MEPFGVLVHPTHEETIYRRPKLITITTEGKASYKAHIDGHEVLMGDGHVSDVAAPSPVKYFAAAYATCHAMVSEAFLRKHKLADEGVNVTIDYQVAQGPKRVGAIQMSIELPVEIPEELAERYQATLKACTIGGTLAVPPEVETTITTKNG